MAFGNNLLLNKRKIIMAGEILCGKKNKNCLI
jgi:hypothetical protein